MVVVLGGQGKDLLLGNVSPLHRRKFMPYEILNEDKMNVGERPFFEELLGKKRGSVSLPPEKFLEATFFRRQKMPLLITSPLRC